MFESYFKGAGVDEGRKAFALDCVIRLEEAVKRTVGTDESWTKGYVERAKAFEDYLKGQE